MNNTKHLSLALFFTMCLMVMSCSSSDDEADLMGNWVEMGSFEGVPRSDAVAFVVGDYAYVGTGYDGVEDERLNDFWRYDAERDFWTQVASLPGAARNGAVAFSVDGKGYVSTGYDGKNRLNDTWAYDPATNSWTQKADFPASPRYGAVAFALNNTGYVGTGYDGNMLKDFWAYSPETDSWEQKLSIGGKKRRDAVAFVIDDKAYVCTGTDNGQYLDDLWVYDSLTDNWTQKRDISDNNDDESYDDEYQLVGLNGAAFTVNGLGYLSAGGPGAPGALTWEYNPDTDLWVQRSDIEGSPRFSAVAFVVNNEPFVATGNSGGYYFDDVWTFRANEVQDDND